MFLNQAAEVGGGRGAGGGGEGRPGNVRTKFHMAPTPRGRLHYPGTLAVLAPGEFRREKLPPNSDEHNISHMKQPELLAWVGGDVSAVQRTQICHTRACSIVMHDSLHALPRALTTLHVSLLGSPIPVIHHNHGAIGQRFLPAQCLWCISIEPQPGVRISP